MGLDDLIEKEVFEFADPEKLNVEDLESIYA
jgi:hypothetical protein